MDYLTKLPQDMADAAVRLSMDQATPRSINDWQIVLNNTVHYSGVFNAAYQIKYYDPGVDVNGLFNMQQFVAALTKALYTTPLISNRHTTVGTKQADGSVSYVDADIFVRTITPSEYRQILAANPEAAAQTFPEETGYVQPLSGANPSPALGGGSASVVNQPTGIVQTTASSVPNDSTPSQGTLTTAPAASNLERELRDAASRNNWAINESHNLDNWGWLLQRTVSFNAAQSGPDTLTPGWSDRNIQYTLQEFMQLQNSYLNASGDVIRQTATVVADQMPSGMMNLFKMLYDLIGRILAGKR